MLLSRSLKEQDFKKSMVLDKTPIKPPGAPRFKLKGNTEKKSSDRAITAMSTEEEFCQDLLVEGYVQSFVDFYHLTHRADPNSTDGSHAKIHNTPEDMSFIRNNLVLAELSRRQGNIIGVYTAYNKLAGSYKKKMDWKTAIFFQKKCLEVAQLTTDLKAEMSANHTLGEVYQQMGEYGDARLRHERHEEIAVSIESAEDIIAANVELHKVYLVIAQRQEQEQEQEQAPGTSTDDALKMYEMCLGASIKCTDLAAQGEANGKIGNLLLRRGDAAGALPYLEQHSEISTNIGDTEARCRACSSLAWALDSLGEDKRALAELSLVHSISEQAGDAYLQSQACRALGTLYSKVGQLKEAVSVLQRHFELVKAITSSAGREEGSTSSLVTIGDLELARVFVGISKGNLMMNSYMFAINFNMNSLLDWKLSRAELGAGP